MKIQIASEIGMTLIEVLVGMFILSLVSLGLAKSMTVSVQSYKNVQITSAMRNLAQNKLEQFAAINPQSIDSNSHDSNEVNLTVPFLSSLVTFDRDTDAIVNADGSRSIEVTVTCNHPKYTDKVFVERSTFTRW